MRISQTTSCEHLQYYVNEIGGELYDFLRLKLNSACLCVCWYLSFLPLFHFMISAVDIYII